MANTMMQKFWDSTLALEPPEDDYDTRSELSALMASDYAENGRSTYPLLGSGNSFAFKFEDQKKRVHRFTCGTENLGELVSAVMQRIGLPEGDKIQLLYEDDEGDRVLLATNNDLFGAVNHARSTGWKVLRLHIDTSDAAEDATKPTPELTAVERYRLGYLKAGVTAGAILLASMGIIVFFKRIKL